MNPNHKSEGYNGAFLERSGKGSLHLAEILVAEPELPIDESQKQEVYEYEKSIYDYKLEPGLTINETIRSHKGEATTAPRFFADAFLRGKVDLPQLGTEITEFSSSEDVYKWLATSVRDSTIDEPTLLKMSKESANYYKQIVADLLVAGETPEPSIMDNMSIVINPADTVKLSLSLVQARQFLHSMRHKYKEGGDRLDGAKRALTDVYLAKVNSLVVSDITTLDYLVNQSNLIGDDDTKQIASELVNKGMRRLLDSNELKTLKNLDYIRNGIGKDENGRTTAVDNMVVQEDSSETGEAKLETPLFNQEQRDKLKAFKLDPPEMVKLYSRVLQKAGQLSSEDPSTWSPKRKHRAADELLQVVVNPTANSFAVLGISGAYKVASEPRSLFDIIVVGGAHELEHVNQVQNDRALGEKLSIAELKGKRVGMLRESGANFKQREAELALFGESKPIALAYARALQIIENDGGVFDATRAFFEEKRRITPNLDIKVIAKEAADRVLRLTLNGGINSQPMSYAEEIILNKELRFASPELKERAIAVTSLDLVDQVRLHKYDLLPALENQNIDWLGIILKEAEPYITEALRQ